MSGRLAAEADRLAFSPGILRAQEAAPSPLARVVLRALLVLVALLVVWAVVGRLDVVAVAPGKLVPRSFVKIVQPAENGIVREILVSEGERVREGQVLARMDTRLSDADRNTVDHDVRLRALQLRRIDAELSGKPMAVRPDDPVAFFTQVESQYRARRAAYRDALEAEQASLAKARQDVRIAEENESKLRKTVPIFQEQAEGWNKLAQEGFAGRLLAMDRQRQYLESAQDLKAQGHTIASLRASIEHSEKRLAQITSGYRQQLQAERVETASQLHRLQQELDKQSHRAGLSELRAPQAGLVKDLATHTPGTVVASGTVLMTLVPQDEPLQAEIWISNQDAGFVRPKQPVRLKLATFPFQKYGMLDGVVSHVGADASDRADANAPGKPPAGTTALAYRALVEFAPVAAGRGTTTMALSAGMQVQAEIHLGSRSVMEYVISPVAKTVHEAGRER